MRWPHTPASRVIDTPRAPAGRGAHRSRSLLPERQRGRGIDHPAGNARHTPSGSGREESTPFAVPAFRAAARQRCDVQRGVTPRDLRRAPPSGRVRSVVNARARNALSVPGSRVSCPLSGRRGVPRRLRGTRTAPRPPRPTPVIAGCHSFGASHAGPTSMCTSLQRCSAHSAAGHLGTRRSQELAQCHWRRSLCPHAASSREGTRAVHLVVQTRRTAPHGDLGSHACMCQLSYLGVGLRSTRGTHRMLTHEHVHVFAARLGTAQPDIWASALPWTLPWIFRGLPRTSMDSSMDSSGDSSADSSWTLSMDL